MTTEKNLILDCFECSELDVNDLGKPIQLLKVGEFMHPEVGKVVITKQDLERFADNFSRKVRKIELAINYEHLRSTAHGTKAAGWIKEILIKADGAELWAVPEWTPEGLKQIKDKEFRYISAELFWAYTDNETGMVYERVLKGAALTNYPVIKGMVPIAASELTNEKNGSENTMTLSEIKLKLSELGFDFAEIEKKAKGFDEVSIKLASVETQLSELTKERDTLKGDVAKAVATSTALQKKVDDLKFSELVTKGMAEGRLTKVLAEGTFKKLFEKNGTEFAETFLSEMPVIVDVNGSVGHGGNVENAESSDINKQITKKAEELMEKEKIDFSEAVSRVLKDDAKLAEAHMKLGE
jgi:phage I-like protein